MAADWGRRGMDQPEADGLSVPRLGVREEPPIPRADTIEVTPLHPAGPLPGMPPACPLPEQAEDDVVNAAESPFGYDMPVIVRPPSDDRVELAYQSIGRSPRVSLNDRAHLSQEGPGVLLRRFDQELPVGVAPDVLAEEVEPLAQVRDRRLLG